MKTLDLCSKDSERLSFSLVQQVNSIDSCIHRLDVTGTLLLPSAIKTASNMKGNSLIKHRHSKYFLIGFLKVSQMIERRIQISPNL